MATHLTFGLGSTAQPYQRQGWSTPEQGCTWSVGPRSQLALPRPGGGGDLLLEMQLRPFLRAGQSGQRLIVHANSRFVDELFLRDEAIICLRIQAAFVPERKLLLDFHQPDAVRSAASGSARDLGFAFESVWLDAAPALPPFEAISRAPLPGASVRDLARAAQAATGLSLADLATCFESIGSDATFGRIQDACGADPPGLLRFASITPARLLAGLRQGFAGIAAPDNLETVLDANDPAGAIVIRDRTYRTVWRSFENDADITPQAMLLQAARAIPLLHRKFVENLSGGEKIWVFQHPHARNAAMIRPIAAALAGLGPNMLLWAAEGTGLPPGSATVLQRGLVQAAVGGPGESEGHLAAWISIMANTYRIWQQAGYGRSRV